jgi:hypothetical protein
MTQSSSQHLNVYGDVGRHGTEFFGIDISAERLDWLDMQCLGHVVEHAGEHLKGLDLGCGRGRPSIAFSIAGAHMHLIDIEDMSRRFKTLSAKIPLYGLEFTCHDLKFVDPINFWKHYSFCYSQRTIHYLTFFEAVTLLRLVASRMTPGSPLWLSASGIYSELGQGYAGVMKPIESRFGYLSREMAEKHQINAPVCLYSKEDLTYLGETSGFRIAEIKLSDFGNIKEVFRR